MILNSFKLKAASVKMGFDKTLEVIGTDIDKKNGIYYNRVKSQYKDMPMFFNIITFEGQTKVDLQDLQEVVNEKKLMLDDLLKKDFSKEHAYYLKDINYDIWGSEFEMIEDKNALLTWRIIEAQIEELKREKNNNFKEMLIDYEKKISIEELRNQVGE